MADTVATMREQTRLRRAAENLLAEGRAPRSRGWELGSAALALLYRLAGEADNSEDVLAVLHELQVHQVELDLQLEQLESNEEQLTDELEHFRDLYQHAPAGYLRITRDGRVLEANEAATRMLAPPAGDAARTDGSRVFDLVSPEDRPLLTAALQRLDSDHVIESCDVRAVDAAAEARALRITARLEPDSDNAWVVVSR